MISIARHYGRTFLYMIVFILHNSFIKSLLLLPFYQWSGDCHGSGDKGNGRYRLTVWVQEAALLFPTPNLESSEPLRYYLLKQIWDYNWFDLTWCLSLSSLSKNSQNVFQMPHFLPWLLWSTTLLKSSFSLSFYSFVASLTPSYPSFYQSHFPHFLISCVQL